MFGKLSLVYADVKDRSNWDLNFWSYGKKNLLCCLEQLTVIGMQKMRQLTGMIGSKLERKRNFISQTLIKSFNASLAGLPSLTARFLDIGYLFRRWEEQGPDFGVFCLTKL